MIFASHKSHLAAPTRATNSPLAAPPPPSLATSVEALEHFGLEACWVRALARAGVSALNTVQTRAVRETALLHGGNVVVLSPTGSGKTLVAELAMLRAVSRGRAAAMLVPTRALAEEQAATLIARYAGTGLRVAVSTRERTQHDAAIAAGAFDVAVLVYEKFRALLGAETAFAGGGEAWGQRGLLRALGLVVLDELQIVGDGDRGADVAMLVSWLAAAAAPQPMSNTAGRSLQLVAMSAVVEPADPVVQTLAATAAATILTDDTRPVPLREGVWDGETAEFVFCESEVTRALYNATSSSSLDNRERLGAPPPPAPALSNRHHRADAQQHAVRALVQELACVRGEQVIVFVPTRAATMRYAHALARACGADLAAHTCGDETSRTICDDILNDAEACRVAVLLRDTLASSVAFHNADLPAALRAAVEDAFRAGRIRVLVTTSTLAQGVNLAGRNVISLPEMVAGECGGALHGMVPISVRRWRNQGGRAGRDAAPTQHEMLRRSDEHARSILVAVDATETLRLRSDYLRRAPEPLHVAMDTAARQRGALLLIAAAGAAGIPWNSAAAAVAQWQTGLAQAEAMSDSDILAALRWADAIVATPDGARLRATGLGEIAARFGLHLDTLHAFATWLRATAARADALTEMEILALLVSVADSAHVPVFATRREIEDCTWPAALAGRRDVDVAAFAEPVGATFNPAAGFCENDQHLVKRLLIADTWISSLPTPALEAEFATHSGTASALGAHLAWLAEALARAARVLGCAPTIVALAEDLAVRLTSGIASSGVALARLNLASLTRSAAQRLLREGLADADSLREFLCGTDTDNAAVLPNRRDQLAAWIGKHATDELCVRLKLDSSSANPAPTLAPATAAPDAPPTDVLPSRTPPQAAPQLTLRDGSPGQVWCGAQSCVLSEMPYRLLRLLAERPGHVVGYEEIDRALWPDAKVERQQVSYHRYALVRALRPMLGAHADELIITEKRLGLRLGDAVAVRVAV